jgi:hypothetical protein
VHRKDDLLCEEGRPFNLLRCLQESGVLILGEVSEPRVVFVENFTRRTGFEAARLRVMHQLKKAFRTARSLSTVL